MHSKSMTFEAEKVWKSATVGKEVGHTSLSEPVGELARADRLLQSVLDALHVLAAGARYRGYDDLGLRPLAALQCI